jgi:16S rRNA (cytosine967-C5)-methyltransferase
LANHAGLLARRTAADLVEDVLCRRRPLDEQLQHREADPRLFELADRDRALARAISATVLRRLGTLRHLLARLLERGLPASATRVEIILLVGAAQILWLDIPGHAAVDLAVRLARSDRRSAHYAGLVNAVLRRLVRQRTHFLADLDVTLDTPAWFMARWRRHYGADMARAIAIANDREAALDFTLKARAQAQLWADKLGGRVLPTGSVRAVVHGSAAQLPGYGQGAWWVQDAAAALPARLLGDVAGRSVADLCAAPGGKTAQLAAAGATVVAVDRSARRLERLRQNLVRLDLKAQVVEADVLAWQGGPFDAVVLDAPCSSTGTIRRHPDIPWIKQESDIAVLASLQRQLLARAADLVKPGGLLIYSTCSLEPEEGTEIIRDFLSATKSFVRRPIMPGEMQVTEDWLTVEGDLRTLPCHLPDANPVMAGLDGFYAARLERA